ncbi:GntR family transcriptional regulator [Enemella evansiae]|nr:GntR family transcriptional regulator [Enemella evansiae]
MVTRANYSGIGLVEQVQFWNGGRVDERWLPGPELAALLGEAPLRPPRYADLADRITRLIIDGRVPAGARLTSERELAGELGVSRTTVTEAYRKLVGTGVVRPRRGSGHWVRGRPRPATSDLLPVAGPDEQGRIGLTVAANPAPAALGPAVQRATERLPRLAAGIGYFPDGLPELRAAIADRYATRGLATRPEQILITPGSLAGLHVVARTLRRGRRPFAVEAISHSANLRMLDRLASLAPFDMAPEGWGVESLRQVLGRRRPVAVSLVPEFHNPTGRLMPEQTRVAIARVAAEAGVRLIADETLVDLGFTGQAERPLAAYAPDAVLVGSASKSFWGGLRLGWIRSPDDLIDPLLRVRTLDDHGAAALEQLILLELLAVEDEVTAEHRPRNLARAEHLMGLLAARLPEWRWVAPEGGHTLWLELPAPRSTALVAAARRQGVLLAAGPQFHATGAGERWLRVPWTAEPHVLDTAIERLARAWSEVADTPGTPAAAAEPLSW